MDYIEIEGYKSIKDAPKYMDKKYLLKLRIKYFLSTELRTKLLLTPLKIICIFIPKRHLRNDFRAKYIHPLNSPKSDLR